MTEEKEVSETVLTLLRYAKSPHDSGELSIEAIGEVLAPLYYTNGPMAFKDIMQIVMSAYFQVLSEPRFEAGISDRRIQELVMAPITGFHAVEWPGPKNLDELYSVRQVYTSFLSHIMSVFRFTRVDWVEKFQTEDKLLS